MAVNIDDLEAKARAAIELGQLKAEESVTNGTCITGDGGQGYVAVDVDTLYAPFLLAANPAAVLELVERVRAAEREADQGAEAARQHFRSEAKLAVLEAIVRDLAASFHHHDTDPNQRGAPCRLCLGVQGDHREECPGRRAVETGKTK